MEITVKRGADDGQSVIGQLSIDTDPFTCYTLEPSIKAQYPLIQAGRYKVALLLSPRFGEITPHVQGVPGRSFIEIHPGNKPKDTLGCTLVGETEAIDWVGSSRAAFVSLMAVLEKDQDDLWVTYVDPTVMNAASGTGGGD